MVADVLVILDGATDREADRELIGPLATAVREAGGRIRVGPDHGRDPSTGAHVGRPVVIWSGSAA